MNKRLQQFLNAENISQSQFAESINVARASVSHILSGRNKPSFDFIESVMLHYPTLNPEWLITGKGRMYNNGSERSGDLFTEPSESPAAPASADSPSTVNNAPSVESIASSYAAQHAIKEIVSAKDKKITKVIVYYSDYSYTEIV